MMTRMAWGMITSRSVLVGESPRAEAASVCPLLMGQDAGSHYLSR